MNWKEQAINLAIEGYSWRKVANMLGKSKSTVSDYLRIQFKSSVKAPEAIKHQGPRILIYDIETAPIIAQMWSMWQQGFGLNQIQEDWYILSFAAKWYGEDEVFYYDQSDAESTEDDSAILSKLWDLLDEADIVVGQNLKKFDTKKVNARFVLNGFPKPSTYRQIDTLDIAKQQFGFTSNKLEYMSSKLCKSYVKSKHKKFPGHELWSECLKGNPEAWEEMKEYNIGDIKATEELYELFTHWDNKLPNFDVYVDDVVGLEDWEEIGFHYTNLGKYTKYQNKITGQQKRGRINLLSKEKRASLLANII